MLLSTVKVLNFTSQWRPSISKYRAVRSHHSIHREVPMPQRGMYTSKEIGIPQRIYAGSWIAISLLRCKRRSYCGMHDFGYLHKSHKFLSYYKAEFMVCALGHNEFYKAFYIGTYYIIDIMRFFAVFHDHDCAC